MRTSTCGTVMLVCATILGPITIVFLAVSFATDHWLEFKVDRSKFTVGNEFDRVAHTRYRGIFRECYPGNDTEFLSRSKDVVDNYCFNIDYDVPESHTSNPSTEFLARIHLSRCFLAFYVVALVVFLLAFIFGLVVCCWRRSKWAYIAGLCAYIAAFATAAAIAFFHGAEYLERNKIEDKDIFYSQWPAPLQSATTRSYGWSYILGWVGMILAALSATFYSVAGCYIGGERYDDKEYLEKRREFQESQMGPDYYYGRPYPQPAMIGPYVYDMETRRPLPAIGYGDPYVSWS
ncbi:transmembrane protein 178B-like [Saccostrea cucullata]|uniref:transmembrane protein 178B-like n=1 Tax=Saccostrea cuccullata TaxID=36930 RepID=UPI002ED0B076